MTDNGSWQQRLEIIVDMMRDMSRHTDPQAMVRSYADRIAQLLPVDRRLSLSRRGLASPEYLITRSTTWPEEINPWRERHRLPLFGGGLLAELIYVGEPRLIEDLEVAGNEPAAEYLNGFRTLLAIPMYDQGEALNMVVLLQQEPRSFPHEQIPDAVWRSNLFGRATSNLVLKEELRQAYQALDHEMKTVGDIQRALLPAELPRIDGLDLAAHYQPARRAGGDYYDFFPLADGRWGIFIADASGHGTPAAVVMALTHCIAHTRPGPPAPPSQVLSYVNHQLATRYAGLHDSFVTGFYGVFDPARRELIYSCAGHNPPRVKRCRDGSVMSLDAAVSLPLGIRADAEYSDAVQLLSGGDQIVFYTDGIVETVDSAGHQFGTQRLDAALASCKMQASGLLQRLLESLDEFAAGRAADDDRTMIVARVTR